MLSERERERERERILEQLSDGTEGTNDQYNAQATVVQTVSALVLRVSYWSDPKTRSNVVRSSANIGDNVERTNVRYTVREFAFYEFEKFKK